MNKVLLPVVLVSLLLPMTGAALPPPGENLVGLYTADDGTGFANLNCDLGQREIYLLMTGCAEPGGISGWELRVNLPDHVLVLYWQIHGQYCSDPTPPDLAIGLAIPFPQTDVILLLTMAVLVQDTTPGFVFLGPVSWPSIPGEMCFAAGDNPGNLQPLIPSSGDHSLPVFGFNTGPLPHLDRPTIPNQCRTWGAVKVLYK